MKSKQNNAGACRGCGERGEKGWTDEQEEQFKDLLTRFHGQSGSIITALQGAQEIFGYLPREAMVRTAAALRVAPAAVFGVATFYAQFSFEPRGRHTILACQGTACHVRGGDTILKEILRELDVEKGGTTTDGRFTVEEVYCIGACSLAPAIIVDDDVHAKLTPKKTKEVLGEYE